MKSVQTNSVAAIIVTFYPNIVRLYDLTKNLIEQVGVIYIIDNTPGYELDLKIFIEFHPKRIKYIPLYENMGIAHAQNIGIKNAAFEGCTHVIFFDQDSLISSSFVEKLFDAEIKLLSSGVKVGVVAPLFYDEQTGEYCDAIRYSKFFAKKIKINKNEVEAIQSDHVISSGSLVRLSVLNQVGLMNKKLFIDLVDTEWCLRASVMNFKHYIIPSAQMNHSIGDSSVNFRGRKIKIHNNLRNYYVVRNMTYLFFYGKVTWGWRVNCIYRLPRYIWIFIAISPKNKFNILILMLIACVNGILGRLDGVKANSWLKKIAENSFC